MSPVCTLGQSLRIFSAKGAIHTSLGQRPRNAVHEKFLRAEGPIHGYGSGLQPFQIVGCNVTRPDGPGWYGGGPLALKMLSV
jgi:hypothetical protein